MHQFPYILPTAQYFAAGYLCKSAVSVVELCSLPSHDSEKSNGASRTLLEWCRGGRGETLACSGEE